MYFLNGTKKPERERQKWLKDLTFYGSWGFEFAFTILAGTILGYFLDHRFKTTPWLTIVGFLLGSLSAYVTFWRWVKEGK
jgi:F0F1-type ATP synthase assembly protein I